MSAQLAAARYVGLLIAAIAVGVGVVVLGGKLFGAAAGPDAELITRLKTTEKSGLTLTIPGAAAPLVASSHRYDRLTAWSDPGSGTLILDCTLELKGRLGDVEIGAFTSEKLVFRYVDGDWEPEGGYAPSLTAVVAALEARRVALQRMDRAQLEKLRSPSTPAPPRDEQELGFLQQLRNRQYRVEAWYLRAEPDEAIVTEDFRLTGDLPEEPVDQRSSRRLILKRSGREFFFWPGIM